MEGAFGSCIDICGVDASQRARTRYLQGRENDTVWGPFGPPCREACWPNAWSRRSQSGPTTKSVEPDESPSVSVDTGGFRSSRASMSAPLPALGATESAPACVHGHSVAQSKRFCSRDTSSALSFRVATDHVRRWDFSRRRCFSIVPAMKASSETLRDPLAQQKPRSRVMLAEHVGLNSRSFTKSL